MNENKENKVKCWERLPVSKTYWYIDGYNRIKETAEMYTQSDNCRYQSGNYYYSEEEATYYADKQRLINDIRRWKRIHDNGTVNWKNLNQNKVGIGYLHEEKRLKPMEYMYAEMLFSTFFTSVEIAEECYETFRDEIVSVLERGESWE